MDDAILYFGSNSFPTLKVLAWRAVHNNDLGQYDSATQELIVCIKPSEQELKIPSQSQPPMFRMRYSDGQLHQERWCQNQEQYS
jgi:hypothetical protein